MLTIQEAAKLCGVSLDDLNVEYWYTLLKSGMEYGGDYTVPQSQYISLVKNCIAHNRIDNACYWLGVVIEKSKGE